MGCVWGLVFALFWKGGGEREGFLFLPATSAPNTLNLTNDKSSGDFFVADVNEIAEFVDFVVGALDLGGRGFGLNFFGKKPQVSFLQGLLKESNANTECQASLLTSADFLLPDAFSALGLKDILPSRSDEVPDPDP